MVMIIFKMMMIRQEAREDQKMIILGGPIFAIIAEKHIYHILHYILILKQSIILQEESLEGDEEDQRKIMGTSIL